MAEIAYFVPGRVPSWVARQSPLRIYLPTMPAGVASAYIQATTQPGDLILDPFCQTPQVVCEALALGRRVLAANFNPVVIRAVDLLLPWADWPDQQAMGAAFTHLADSVTGNETLRARLAAHYTTRCPTCKKSAQAEYFVWERDQLEPIEKCVRCKQCNAESRGPTDKDDLALAARYEARSLPYWLLLDRVVSAEHGDERERAAAVLATYTPRALAAISDILIRFDALPKAERNALRPLLLETLATCSAIHPHEEEQLRSPRPRSLKPPPRFIEQNVWRAMEDCLKYSTTLTDQARLPRVADVRTLLDQRDPAACLVARSSRDLDKLIGPGSVALAIGTPPQLDPTFWALSAVWSAWLWGAHAAELTQPLLSRRRADVDWLWRMLAPPLEAVSSLLTDSGKVVLVHPAASEEWLGGLTLAGARAGLALEHVLVESHDGLRLSWKRGSAAPQRQLDIEALGMEIMEVAERAALDVLRARGEPVTWPQLMGSLYHALACNDLLHIVAYLPDTAPPALTLLTHVVRGAFEGRETALQRLALPVGQGKEYSQELWWTNRSLARMGLPLSDLVEMAVYDALQQTTEWNEADLVAGVYRRFQAATVPERALVAMCMNSYAHSLGSGVCALREEDYVEARRREMEELMKVLHALGGRLGWEVDVYDNGRIVWAERRIPAYTFSFSTTAQLAPCLLTKRPPRGTPVLVIPGGRAGLIEYKLRRNVLFSDAVAGAGWQFLKFRHLRKLAGDATLSPASFREALVLDPLIAVDRQMTLL